MEREFSDEAWQTSAILGWYGDRPMGDKLAHQSICRPDSDRWSPKMGGSTGHFDISAVGSNVGIVPVGCVNPVYDIFFQYGVDTVEVLPNEVLPVLVFPVEVFPVR